MSEGKTNEQPPVSPKLTRRQFVQLVAAGVGLATLFAKDGRSRVENEPGPTPNPLVVDFTPSAKVLETYDTPSTKGLISPETELFDPEAIQKKFIGVTSKELTERIDPEGKFNDDINGFYAKLMEEGLEKEALVLILSNDWSAHGFAVANHMRTVQSELAKPVSHHQVKPEDESKDAKPFNFIPLQNYIQSFKKLDNTDEFGNSYYEVEFDHLKLAHDITQSSETIINCSFNIKKVRIRLVRHLPSDKFNQTIIPENGFLTAYSARLPDTVNDQIVYPVGNIAVETAYNYPGNLEALQQFCQIITDSGKIVILSSGNSQATLPRDFKMPKGAFLISAWDQTKQKPEHNFDDPSGTVYYIDPNNYSNIMGTTSSPAAAQVSIWLKLQSATNADQARGLLDSHSRIDRDGHKILDFGAVPTEIDWDDKQKYRPID